MILHVDEAHCVLETALSLISIVFNAFLLYLIAKHSTYDGKIYQVCLVIDATLDLALGVISLLAKPVSFTGEGYLVIASNNSLKLPLYDTFVLMTYFVVLNLNVLWIPVQFAYRYIFICRPPGSEPPKRKACLVGVVAVLWNCMILYSVYQTFHPPEQFQEEGLRMLRRNGWPYDVESPPRVHGSDTRTLSYIVNMSCWLVSTAGGAIVVAICEIKIIRYFRQFGSTLSAKTRRMHKEFHRALLAMAICPLATSGLPVAFFLVTSMLSIVPGPMSAFFTTALSSIAVFNPLTTIFFMRCYRDVVFRCFRMPRRQRIVDSTTVSGLELETVV